MTSGRWDKKGYPHSGYTPVSVIDSGEVTDNCEMCGTAIRYLHNIHHKESELDITVGCCCAEKLCDDYTGGELETELRRIAKKRDSWIRKEPKKFVIDGAICTQDKINKDTVVIYSEHGKVGFIIEQPDGDVLISENLGVYYNSFAEARKTIAEAYDEEGWL